MAKVKKGNVTKKTQKQESLVVQELNVVSADRSRKDTSYITSALITAEGTWHPNRVRLYDLYSDIMRDGHLTGIINKRMDAVLNKTIFFKDKSGKHVNGMDTLIDSEVFREVIRKIIEVQLYGISGMEFIPGEKLTFEEIPRKHIKPKEGVISYNQYDNAGFEYDPVTNLWVPGKKDDLGLLLKCAPYAIWKRGAMADWSQYIEMFGQPVRVIKYDAYDQKTKIELKQVLDESGSSLALMIPNQAEFEMMDGKGVNGTGELQEKFKMAADAEMSVIILGNTETTTSSSSSGYAQSKEHGKQQLEVTKSDIKYVRSKLNSDRFLNILRSYGYPVEGGTFEFEKETDLEALKLRLSIDKEVSNKVPVGDDYWYETYGIEKPDNYDELKAEKQAREDIEEEQAEDEEPEPAKEKGKKKRTKNAQKPPKRNLTDEKITRNFWFSMRSALADFFDPARLK